MWEFNFAIIAILFFSVFLFSLLNFGTRYGWVRVAGMVGMVGIVVFSFPLIANLLGKPKDSRLEYWNPEKIIVLGFHLVTGRDIYLWILDPLDPSGRPISYRFDWFDPMARKLAATAEESGEGQNGQMQPFEFERPFEPMEDEPIMHPPPVAANENKAEQPRGVVIEDTPVQGSSSFGAPSSIYGGAPSSTQPLIP